MIVSIDIYYHLCIIFPDFIKLFMYPLLFIICTYKLFIVNHLRYFMEKMNSNKNIAHESKDKEKRKFLAKGEWASLV